MPVCDRAHVAGVARAARRAWHDWQDVGTSERVAVLERLARLLADARPGLAQQMAVDVGKPIAEAHAEVTRSIDLLEAVAATPGHEDSTVAASGVYRRCPLGLVAMITPWNNPVAIPLGKLAPALLFGNTVLWKPAPPGAAIACQLMRLIGEAGFPAGVVSLVCGDRDTAVAVMMSEHVDAVTLSGSSAAGYSAQEICARRRIPLQAELGGNNAAIVWSDADLEAAAAKIVNGAFGFAGQRCTANRRVILDARCYHAFVDMLREHAANMVWGDPLRGDTALGPVISMAKRRQIQALVNRSTPADSVLFVHGAPRAVDDRELHAGAYYPPTIIACDDPTHEIVQEESFGPVLVVQKASDWEHALALLNDVRQGLVAALFSESRRLQESFIRTARAGILKIDQASAGAGVDLPFGGWKDSGVGPPEHGPANREFYTRAQAIYGSSRQR
jgi:acyl-CoA reductase-like NAD-dependent aldehyde dehydrogenase